MLEQVTLVCPPGAERAPISDGRVSYDCWHDAEHGLWLVRVPAYAALYLCWNDGYRRAPEELQKE